jgi:hypothetical protein
LRAASFIADMKSVYQRSQSTSNWNEEAEKLGI